MTRLHKIVLWTVPTILLAGIAALFLALAQGVEASPEACEEKVDSHLHEITYPILIAGDVEEFEDGIDEAERLMEERGHENGGVYPYLGGVVTDGVLPECEGLSYAERGGALDVVDDYENKLDTKIARLALQEAFVDTPSEVQA